MTSSELRDERIKKSTGAAFNDDCPRKGVAYLRANYNEPELRVQTSCKAWSCKSCRDRKLGMVASIMEYGLLVRDSEAYLVSVTYRASGPGSLPVENPVSAEHVNRDWRELVRRLKRLDQFKKMATFRVVELTKRGQPHLHLLWMGITGASFCRTCKPRNEPKKWLEVTCECIQGVLRNTWFSITGDSWIVDVTAIYSNAGAAWYLCKYLRKGMYGKVREGLDRLGFARRYAASQNWPRGDKMERRGTVEKRWKGNRFEYGAMKANDVMDAYVRAHPLMEQMGTDMAAQMKRQKKGKKLANLHETLLQYNSNGGTG